MQEARKSASEGSDSDAAAVGAACAEEGKQNRRQGQSKFEDRPRFDSGLIQRLIHVEVFRGTKI